MNILRGYFRGYIINKLNNFPIIGIYVRFTRLTISLNLSYIFGFNPKIFLGVTADVLGLPRTSSIYDWFESKEFSTTINVPPAKPKQLKNPEIPILKECNNYLFFFLTKDDICFLKFSAALH